MKKLYPGILLIFWFGAASSLPLQNEKGNKKEGCKSQNSCNSYSEFKKKQKEQRKQAAPATQPEKK